MELLKDDVVPRSCFRSVPTAGEQQSSVPSPALLRALSLLSEHGVVPVSSECQQLFPTKIVSRLVKWTAIPYEDYAVSAEHQG